MTSATVWVVVLTASAVCFALKLAGHLVPEHWLADERVARTAALVPAALLAARVTGQTGGAGQARGGGARRPALGGAGVALALRAPFIVVVVLAAVTAAGLRALGWG